MCILKATNKPIKFQSIWRRKWFSALKGAEKSNKNAIWKWPLDLVTQAIDGNLYDLVGMEAQFQ